jgi:hypothetical protein
MRSGFVCALAILMGSIAGTGWAAGGGTAGDDPSRGWRSVASSTGGTEAVNRVTGAVRVAYQPLAPTDRPPSLSTPPATVPPVSSPSVGTPPGSSATGVTVPPSAPSVSAPTINVPSVSTVPVPGSCGSEPWRTVAPVAPSSVGFQPLLPIFSMPPTVYVARGILGQPVIYVPGQPVRNFLRYLGP